MRECWLVHPGETERELWREALPEMQVREALEPCPTAQVLILGSAEWLAAARALAPAVPLVVIYDGDPEPLYAAGARSVIVEPQTPEQRQAVVRFWHAHNLA